MVWQDEVFNTVIIYCLCQDEPEFRKPGQVSDIRTMVFIDLSPRTGFKSFLHPLVS
jgi:hypothetical protein